MLVLVLLALGNSDHYNSYRVQTTIDGVADLRLVVKAIKLDSELCINQNHDGQAEACNDMYSSLHQTTHRVLDKREEACTALRPLITLDYMEKVLTVKLAVVT